MTINGELDKYNYWKPNHGGAMCPNCNAVVHGEKNTIASLLIAINEHHCFIDKPYSYEYGL
jgi:hypothetical protein